MINGTLLCRLSDMSFMPCLMPCRKMSYLLHCPKMCNMSILPYDPNLVAYATIVDATISGQAARLHDPAGRLAKNLSGFQKSAHCGCPRLPVAMGSCNMIHCKMPGCCNFVLLLFSATFSLIYETFSLSCGFRPVQAANWAGFAKNLCQKSACHSFAASCRLDSSCATWPWLARKSLAIGIKMRHTRLLWFPWHGSTRIMLKPSEN